MRHTPDALMLFAAGFGTRMGELTRNLPKPLIPVAGRPLIDHAIGLAEHAGITRIVANVHYRGDQIRTHLAATPAGAQVLISNESEQILETGGGLRKALPLLGSGPVFTLNTDAIWTGPNPLTALRAAWDPARMSAVLMLVPVAQAVGHGPKGDFAIDAQGRLHRGGDYVYTGAQIIAPRGLGAIADPAFSLNVLWDQMLAQGRVYGVVHPGGWCDVGHPASIQLAEAMLHA